MAEKIYAKTWYVYTYAYPECMSGVVFYVGKGTNNRINDHEAEAKRGCPCKKCQVIREIWESGYPVTKRLVFETLDEDKAFAYEARLIHQYDNLVNVIIPCMEEETKKKKAKKVVPRLLPKDLSKFAEENGNALKAFIDEKCLLDPEAMTHTDRLYQAFMSYREKNGYNQRYSKVAFTTFLKEMNIGVLRSANAIMIKGVQKRGLCGIRLKTEEELSLPSPEKREANNPLLSPATQYFPVSPEGMRLGYNIWVVYSEKGEAILRLGDTGIQINACQMCLGDRMEMHWVGNKITIMATNHCNLCETNPYHYNQSNH